MSSKNDKRIVWHVEQWNIESLHPYDKNPRIITEAGLDQLGESFDEIGYAQLININTDGCILSGHARFMQLKREGATIVEVSVPDRKLTPKQEEAVVIRMNKTTAGTWNIQMLNEHFDHDDLIEFGFTEEELKWEVLPEVGSTPDQDAIEDEVPEADLNKECVISSGMLIELGRHRLLCGDCTVKENVDLVMGGEKADMVFTDPPYGVSYSHKNIFLNTISFANRIEKDIENDSKSVPEMFEFWKQIFNICAEVSKDVSCYYICSPQGGELMMMMQAIDQSPYHLKHTLIWNKNNHVLGRCDYHYKHEPILYGWKKKGTHKFYGNGAQNKSVWDINKPLKNDLHPTMKPIELMENALLNSTEKEMLIFEPFCGSGSTLIACEKTNRKCYGMEIDPHYCQVIVERYMKYTGRNDVYIINDGKRIPYSEL